MPLLGSLGNAAETSYRGNYDNYPFDIEFIDIIDGFPTVTYKTPLKFVDGINYKVPISVSGDGDYYVGNLNFDESFDNTNITFDSIVPTFDIDYPEVDYSTQPNYVRKGNFVGMRLLRKENPTIDDYNKTYSTTITIGKRQFTWTVTTRPPSSAENFTFTSVNCVPYNTTVTSNSYSVKGITNALTYVAEIISGEGLLSVNDGPFVSSAPVTNNDTIKLRVNSSSLNATEKITTVRISTQNGTLGIAQTSWSVTSLDKIPDVFEFEDNLNAERNTSVSSNTITIQGTCPDTNYNVSIVSPSNAFLSVNSSQFVTSTTAKNGDQINLILPTSKEWEEQIPVIAKFEDTQTTWTVKNRTIQPNVDTNADKLIYALSFDKINGIKDVSPEVRTKSSFDVGSRASTVISTSYPNDPIISTEASKFYNSSYKLAKGTSTKNFEVDFLYIQTSSSQKIGFEPFTVEMWMRTNDYQFGGENGMSIFYSSYLDNKNLNDYFFYFFLKGDNWGGTGQRGILVGYPTTSGTVIPICETGRVLPINSWFHLALTRSGNRFYIFINGILQASGNYFMDLTSIGYNFCLPNFQRLIQGDFYVQDLRFYKGIAKYTSSFNVNSVPSIMETY